MPDNLMSSTYPWVTIEDIADSHKGAIKIGPFGSQLKKDELTQKGYKVYGQGNVIANDFTIGERRVSASKFATLQSCRLYSGDVVLSMMGTIGHCTVFPENAEVGIMDSHLLRIQVNSQITYPEFVALAIGAENIVGHQITRMSHGSIMSGLSSTIVRGLEIPLPSLPEQHRIAEILDTADATIRHTERVIAKLRQVKAGLLHDLLSRGLDEHGHLRDPHTHPEQFKDSPLGRIPREWTIRALGEVTESAVDGPFGSNLKTEHYVDQPGIRVVRLQNIGYGYFDNTDEAYVSEAHARTLQRHEIVTGDLLVASLGDKNHPIARSCLYPLDLQPGIVKADCFRFRLRRSVATHAYIMYVMNCPSTRDDVDLLGHGVTRDRIPLTTLLRARVRVPSIAEQNRVIAFLDAHDTRIHAEDAALAKLRQLKRGLMDDLLTGKVRVKI